jgi:hypothetical protein
MYGQAQAEHKATWPTFIEREVMLAMAFGFIPFVGVIGVRLGKGPFFDRYFLSCIAGYAIFLGLASSRSRPRLAKVLAACMVFFMVGDLGTAFFHSVRHSDATLTEPSSKFVFAATPADPLNRDKTLLTINPQMDILVLGGPNYLYFFRYAPAALMPHLYFGVPDTSDIFFLGYVRLAKWTHIDLRLTTFEPFFASHKHLFVYASVDGPAHNICGNCEQVILNGGYTLKSVRRDTDGTLYEYQR